VNLLTCLGEQCSSTGYEALPSGRIDNKGVHQARRHAVSWQGLTDAAKAIDGHIDLLGLGDLL
jgi:hypothetical protein